MGPSGAERRRKEGWKAFTLFIARESRGVICQEPLYAEAVDACQEVSERSELDLAVNPGLACVEGGSARVSLHLRETYLPPCGRELGCL